MQDKLDIHQQKVPHGQTDLASPPHERSRATAHTASCKSLSESGLQRHDCQHISQGCSFPASASERTTLRNSTYDFMETTSLKYDAKTALLEQPSRCNFQASASKGLIQRNSTSSFTHENVTGSAWKQISSSTSFTEVYQRLPSRRIFWRENASSWSKKSHTV